jgi:hypothetical protein
MEACSGRSLLIYSPRASQAMSRAAIQPAGNTDDADVEEKEIVGLLMVICNNK